MHRELAADDRVVAFDQVAPTAVAEPPGGLGRVDDVGEEDGGEGAFGLAAAPEVAASDPLAEMIAAEKAAQESGRRAEWGAPSPTEEAAVNALLRATGRG